MTNTIITKIADIHIGDRTHSQLHEITPVNFNTMNAIVSSPVNPIPFVVLLFSFISTPHFLIKQTVLSFYLTFCLLSFFLVVVIPFTILIAFAKNVPCSLYYVRFVWSYFF